MNSTTGHRPAGVVTAVDLVCRRKFASLVLLSVAVGIDGRYVARFEQNQHVVIELAPGRHELRLAANAALGAGRSVTFGSGAAAMPPGNRT